MFSLANGKLIRINSDGSEAEPIQTKNSSLSIGTSVLSDCCISNSTLDPTTTLAYEISTDNFGRVIISNKCGAQLFVNGELVSKKRPLLNNSHIEIPNNVRFRWIHSNDMTETRDSEFASWSDPGKKNKIKSKWTVEKGRLTTHALHLLSSAQDDSSFNDSKNNGVHSFVDENDENSKFEAETTARTDNEHILNVCNFNLPTPKKILEDEQNKPTNDSILPNDLSVAVLSMSQIMLTSYVAPDNQMTPRIANSKRESTAYSPQSPLRTPKSICSTPSSAAFQPIDQNENSPNRSTSFAILKSPSTPTPGGRSNNSMHLIDLTTPLTVPSTSTIASKSCSRHLLKSAIKKSAIKKMNISVNPVIVNKHVEANTPNTPNTPKTLNASVVKRSNVISSTPITSTKAFSKSSNATSDQEIVDKISEELQATVVTESAARIEASPHVLFSNANDGTSSKQFYVESSNVSAMENLIEATGSSQSNVDVQNNSTATIEQVATAIGSNKSNRVSDITNLSAEEEDALLKIDGDAEVDDEEFNEDFLLAGSTDEEGDPKIDPTHELNVPNNEPTQREPVDECVEECFGNSSDIVESEQEIQISNDSSSKAVDLFYENLINDLNESDLHNPAEEVITIADESNCNETSTHDEEFSSLHASSSYSDDATKIDEEFDQHNAIGEITDEIIVLSSQEQSNIVGSCDADADSTFGNASYTAVRQEANNFNVNQSISQEYSPQLITASTEENVDVIPVVDDELNPEMVADDRDVNDISQSIIANEPFENPNETSFHEQNLTNAPEVSDEFAITATPTTDANVPMTMSEALFAIDNENLHDSNAEMSEVCGVGEKNSPDDHKPSQQTACPDTVDNSVNDGNQIEDELYENISESLPSTVTKTEAQRSSESINNSAIFEGTEVNAFLDALAGSESNDDTANKIMHSNENIPEIVSVNVTEQFAVSDEQTEVEDKDSKNVSTSTIDTGNDVNQEHRVIGHNRESTDDQHNEATPESEVVGIAIVDPINCAQINLENNSEAMSLTSVDGQQVVSSFVDGSIDDEPSDPTTSSAQVIVIGSTNDAIEEQQTHHIEEAESVENIEIVSEEFVADTQTVDASEDSSNDNELIADKSSNDERIYTDQINADDIGTNVSNDQLIEEDEDSNALTIAQFADEVQHDPVDASSIAGTQVAVTENDVQTIDADFENTENDATSTNESIVGAIQAAEENMQIDEDSRGLSIAFSNSSADGEIHIEIGLEPANDKDTVAENVVESYPQELQNIAVDLVIEKNENESKDIAIDSEMEHPNDDIICTSGKHVSETCDVTNESVVNEKSYIDEQLSNQVDCDRIETVVSMSSDDIVGDRLTTENIQDTVAQNDSDSSHPRESEVFEILEKTDIESEDIVTVPDNVESISTDNAQDNHPFEQRLDVIANEFEILEEANETEQMVLSVADGTDIAGLPPRSTEYQRTQDTEGVNKTDIEYKDVELYSKTDNADISELIPSDFCTAATESDVAGKSSILSDINSSGQNEPIDEIDNHAMSNLNTLGSSGTVNPPLDNPATLKMAEHPALNQSMNVISESEICAAETDSNAIELVEPKISVEFIDNADDLEAIAVENESGIVDVSTTNTDTIDLTDDHDSKAKLTANTSEGFNSCTSYNEESLEMIDSTANRSTKDTIETETNKMEESIVAKNDKMEIINSSVVSHVATTMESVRDATKVVTPNIDYRIDAATIAAIIGTGHVQKRTEEISPISSKREEPVLNVKDENPSKTPRSKRVAAQNFPVQMSRTPRTPRPPARFAESAYSTPTAKTPRSTKKLQETKIQKLPRCNAENITEVSPELHIAKQIEIPASGKKRTSQTNQGMAENDNEIDSIESPKLKRKRVAKVEEKDVSEPKPSTSAAITMDLVAAQTVANETVLTPAKRIGTRRNLVEQVVDVENPKRGRQQAKTHDAGNEGAQNIEIEKLKSYHRQAKISVDARKEKAQNFETARLKNDHQQVKTSSYNAANEGAQIIETEKLKRDLRQVTSKTKDNVLMGEGNEDGGKLKRGLRRVPSNGTANADPVAEKSNETQVIEVRAREPIKKVDIVAPKVEQKPTAREEVSTPKKVRGRRQALEKVKNDIEDAITVTDVPTEPIIDKANLPKETRRKRNHSEDEIKNEKSKKLIEDAIIKRSNRKNVNKAKDQIVEDKTAIDASFKSIGSREKIAASTSQQITKEAVKTPEQKFDSAKPVRTNRGEKANIEDPKVVDDGEAAQPPSKKRAVKGAVDTPEAVNQIERPKRTIRKPKYFENDEYVMEDEFEPSANSNQSAKQGVTTTSIESSVSHERVAEVRTKRGRAAEYTKTPELDVVPSATAHGTNKKDEIKGHVVKTIASVEVVSKQKSTGGRKKNQKEHAAMSENRSIEAIPATVTSERPQETASEKNVAAVEPKAEQKATSVRQKDQNELVAINENKVVKAAVATVAPQPQQVVFDEIVAGMESSSKQKPVKGRKKNQQVPVVFDETKTLKQRREIVESPAVSAESSANQKSTRGRKRNEDELNVAVLIAAAKVAHEQQQKAVEESVASVESKSKQKSITCRKRSQQEHNVAAGTVVAAVAPKQPRKIVETMAANVESPANQTSTRNRKRNQEELVGADRAAAATAAPKQQQEAVEETVTSLESKQKSVRNRKKSQQELVVAGRVIAATVAPQQQKEVVEETVTSVESKQKSTRGRKKNQQELVVADRAVVVTVDPKQRKEIVEETVATVELLSKQKSTRGRKKNQQVLIVADSAAAAIFTAKQQQEAVKETVANVELLSKQKSTRGRKKNQELAVADSAAAATVAAKQQQKAVEETVASVESSSKQKSTRGRKKNEQELAVKGGDKPSETVAATIATEQQQEVVPKPKSKKRVAKDDTSDELTLKREKLHAGPFDMKNEESPPKARGSRQTPYAKDGTQDVVVPSSSSAVRNTRAKRLAKK